MANGVEFTGAPYPCHPKVANVAVPLVPRTDTVHVHMLGGLGSIRRACAVQYYY